MFHLISFILVQGSGINNLDLGATPWPPWIFMASCATRLAHSEMKGLGDLKSGKFQWAMTD